MSLNKKIKAFNLNLIRNDIYYDIHSYYKIIATNFYKNIDLEFFNFLFSIIENDEIYLVSCVRLVEFDIFDTLENLFLYLEMNDLKFNKDYIIKEIKVENTEQIVHEYILTPDAFKLCALASPKTNKYREIYLLFEKVQYFYLHYSNLFKVKLINNANNVTNKELLLKITELQEKVDKINEPHENKKRKTN